MEFEKPWAKSPRACSNASHAAASGTGGMVTSSLRSKPTKAASTSSSTSIHDIATRALIDLGACGGRQNRWYVDAPGPCLSCKALREGQHVGLRCCANTLGRLRQQCIEPVGGTGHPYEIVATSRKAACVNSTNATGGASNKRASHFNFPN